MLECRANNIFMYVEEIISQDHTGVFLFYLKKTFLLAALHIYQYLVMENILILKLVPTLFSISLLLVSCIDF